MSRLLHLCLLSALIVAMIVVGDRAVRPAQAQAICTPNHVVQPGDDLYRIALAAGTTWPFLMQLNHIPNANLIFVGQVICLPGSMVGTPASPIATASPTSIVPPLATAAPGSGIVLPPTGVFPSIDFSSRSAAPGDTITITGINFPTNEVADVYITPLYGNQPYVAVAQTTTSANGTVNYNFAIPTSVNGAPLQGGAFSVLVKGHTTGYYGFNFFYNSH
jgi:LysM repeat protein